MSRTYWRYAGWLAFAGLLCGVLLGGLSAWFLASVALAGLTTAALTFNFHIPGALVRLFAVGRTAARYGERLAGHRAALTDQVARRAAFFRGLAQAPVTRASGWQFADQARLADFLDDVEDLDYARLRVGLPATVSGLGLLGGLAATAWIAPLALLPLAASFVALAMLGRGVARLTAADWHRARDLRRRGATAFGAALAAIVSLRAEGAWQGASDDALAALDEADRAVLAIRRRHATLDALAGLLGPVAALSVICAAWLAGARGEALLMPVFLAFAWLVLGEPLQTASRMLFAELRRRAAAADTVSAGKGEALPAHGPAGVRRIAGLNALSLLRRGPDGRSLGAAVDIRLQAGVPLVLTGASGAGKTSLLKQIGGWIGDDVLLADGEPVDAATRRDLTMLSLHDAAVIADTVRANLFAPASDDAALNRALVAVELDGRVAEAGGLDGWIGREVLSLGEAQRLNLARAWLTDRPLVLLDEPTEHLDVAQGERILARLLDRLGDRVVVLSSHRAAAAPGCVRLQI